MRYLGGKSRTARRIVAAITEHVDSVVIWSNEQSKSVAGGSKARPRAVDNVFFIRPTV